jgi:UDP-2,3-diacylglucosamine pyrophosphatase LpxH
MGAERTVVVSDLHLGRGGREVVVPALAPLMAETDELVVNGDVAEMHHPRLRDDAARAVDALRTLAHRSGTRLTLLAGNHDPLISPRRALALDAGRLLITHGDAVHPSLAPWSPAADLLQEAFLRQLETYAPQERGRLDAVLSASRDAASREWEISAARRTPGTLSLLCRPAAIVRIALFWREYPGLVAAFASRHAPDARTIVVGHSHWPGAWRVADRLILNTGSFGFPHRPHAVAIDPQGISLRRVVRDRLGYRLGPEDPARCWPTIEPAVHAASVREGSERPSTAPMVRAA